MTLLIFDTETAGLPLNYAAPYTNTANWPRLVQVAWALYLGQELVVSRSRLVRPAGFEIPAAATAIHGITTAQALAEGLSLADVLTEIADAVTAVATLAGHNLPFDEAVLSAEYHRAGQPVPFTPQHTRLDTMRLSTNLVKLVGPRGGYKWPKLNELHAWLFGQDFAGAHGAAADTAACAACLFALADRNLLPGWAQARLAAGGITREE